MTRAERPVSRLPVRLDRSILVIVTRCIVISAAVVIWQIAAEHAGEGSIAPPPSRIFSGLVANLSDRGVTQALLWALVELCAAFALSTIIGSCAGYIIGARLTAERIGLPILLLLYSIPQVTILPLFILYFGLGPACKIAFGVAHGMFPVALSTIAGMKEAKRHHLLWADSLGASRWKKIKRILLPQALPTLCTGMRLAMSTTLLGVLLAELYVSSSGVGFYTQLFTDSSQGDRLFALVFVLAAIAVALTSAVRGLERRASKWRT